VPAATHVRRAIGWLPPIVAGQSQPGDLAHVSPAIGELNRRRLRHIPKDGGSWADLRFHAERDQLLTLAMLGYVARNDFGSHPDVYGRMAWDRPAPTIKRECGHIGNGRYAHPEQDRLCTVREMATLQGFPTTYVFRAKAVTNRYRHVGDAVPPLISYQLASICKWILTGQKPSVSDMILPDTHLTAKDPIEVPCQRDLFAC
jgi:DNA (cytosine-5)-methyltransferase 1